VEAKIKLKNSGPRNREREENKKTRHVQKKNPEKILGGKSIYSVN